MRPIHRRLAFKIGVTIILVELLIFAAAGYLLIRQFSIYNHQNLETRLLLPAEIINTNRANLGILSDQLTIEQLVGVPVRSAFISSNNAIVINATPEELIGKQLTEIPEINQAWFSRDNKNGLIQHGANTVTSIVPIYSSDGVRPLFFVYVQASTIPFQQEENRLILMMAVSALLVVGVTSLIIYLAFNRLVLVRITAVRQTLQIAQAGQLSARVPPPLQDDEIGDLQHSTNNLISQLQETVSDLIHRIAEQRLTEAALRQSEEKYRDFIESSHDLIVQIDRAGHFIYLNHTAEQIYGFRPEELVGQSAFRFLHRDDRERTEMAFLEWIRGRIAHATLENRQINPTGAIFDMFWSINVQYDSYGNVNYVNAIGRDITKLRTRASSLELIAQVGRRATAILSLDDLLHESVNLISRTFAYYNVVIRLVEGEYVVLRATSLTSLKEMEGVTRLKIGQGITGWVAQHGEPLLAPNVLHEPRYHAELNKMETRSEVAVPIKLKGRIIGVLDAQSVQVGAFDEDDLYTLQAIAAQLAVAIDNAVLYEAAQQEILERRNAEERLQIYTAELERSNRELQNFAYVSSHDLQEPLRKIQMFGDRLTANYGKLLDERGQDYLARMQNAALRMQGLIEDLLAFSRVMTHTDPFLWVNLTQLAQQVVEDLAAQIEQKNGRIHLDPLPTIQADAMQMRQLFQNLIGNALKYHKPNEPPVIHIFSEKFADGYQIKIQDNGIGFDEKYLDRIFTVFQRLHSRTEFEGTGIGLAICRRIVERHGGHISATSQPGAGATFIITLPSKHLQQPDNEMDVI
jgi:PAS domain S-box-containing protein